MLSYNLLLTCLATLYLQLITHVQNILAIQHSSLEVIEEAMSHDDQAHTQELYATEAVQLSIRSWEELLQVFDGRKWQ